MTGPTGPPDRRAHRDRSDRPGPQGAQGQIGPTGLQGALPGRREPPARQGPQSSEAPLYSDPRHAADAYPRTDHHDHRSDQRRACWSSLRAGYRPASAGATAFSLVDVFLIVDGAFLVNGGFQRVFAGNTSGLQLHDPVVEPVSGVFTTAPGTHTFAVHSVRDCRVGASNAVRERRPEFGAPGHAYRS